MVHSTALRRGTVVAADVKLTEASKEMVMASVAGVN
jgi:hypothetical protein